MKSGHRSLAGETCTPHCPRGHLLEAPNLRPGTARMGHRGCLACQRTQSICKWRGVPFDENMADWYYEQIREHGSEFKMPRQRKALCKRGHRLDVPNVRYVGDQCRACRLAYYYCHDRGIPFDKAVADQKYVQIMREQVTDAG